MVVAEVEQGNEEVIWSLILGGAPSFPVAGPLKIKKHGESLERLLFEIAVHCNGRRGRPADTAVPG